MVSVDRHRIVMALALAAGMALAFALAHRVSADELARSFPATEGGRLRIALDFGHVEVVPADVEEVRIEARAFGVGASGVHFDAHAEGLDVVLTGRAEPWVAMLQSAPSVQVRALVPAAWATDLAEHGLGTSALRGLPRPRAVGPEPLSDRRRR